MKFEENLAKLENLVGKMESGEMNLDEMMDKRKSEILKESGINSKNYGICESLSNSLM